MRNKLIKLLRCLEEESGFKNEYTEFFEQYGCDYSIEEYLDFPDYKFVIKRFNDKHSITKENGLISPISSNSIRAEIKRMEADGLVMIGTQEGIKYATTATNQGPDFDEGAKFTIESIVLTTKGKSSWRYFIHKATENPITTVLSSTAIIISIISLFL